MEEEIIKKRFMNKKDLSILLQGLATSHYMVDKFYAEIHKIAIDEITSKGKILPNKSLIPSKFVWDYLKDYGITKESVQG